MRLINLLIVLISLLMMAGIIHWWPASEPPAHMPPPLGLNGARALSDDKLVAGLFEDVSRRLLCAKAQPETWRRLSEPARQLWLSTKLEAELRNGGFLAFLMQCQDGAPDLAEAKSAFSAVGADELAAIAAEAMQVAEGVGARTVVDCGAYVASTHAPPYVRPRGFVDPFAAIDVRFKATSVTGDASKQLLAYGKKHLAEIVAPQIPALPNNVVGQNVQPQVRTSENGSNMISGEDPYAAPSHVPA